MVLRPLSQSKILDNINDIVCHTSSSAEDTINTVQSCWCGFEGNAKKIVLAGKCIMR